jgi:hypothetical protein
MLTVTVLTGRRPALLADTLSAVRKRQPDLLADAHLVVLANGNDRPTRDVIDQHADVIDELHTTDQLLTIGPALSLLADHAQRVGRPFWFHLEDDWRATSSHDWVRQAADILNGHPQVSQVRARLAAEPVMRSHRISRRPIVWEQRDGWRHAAHAHLTFNPSLIRTVDIPHGWPCTSEVHAMRRWLTSGRQAAAQLDPGVFAHTGDDESLRTAVGKE